MARLQTTQSPLANPTRGERIQPGLHADGFAQLHHLGRRTGRDQGLPLLIIQPRKQQKIAAELLRIQGQWAIGLNDRAMALRPRQPAELLFKSGGGVNRLTAFGRHDPEHRRLISAPAQVSQSRQRGDQLRGTDNDRASHRSRPCPRHDQ